MKFISAILIPIMKITGIPLELIFFKRKTYYQYRKMQGRTIKGGALIVSNHHSFWDYIMVFFLFFWYKVRPVVSYEIMHKNKVLTFFLNVVGAIEVSKNPLDVDYINKIIEQIRKGKKVIIFPEGHFAPVGKFLPFSNSYLKIAQEANCPIIPLYTDGHYGFFKRNHVMIGTPVYASDFVKDFNNKEDREQGNTKFVENIKEMGEITEKRAKTPFICFKMFPMDFGKFYIFAHIWPFIRAKVHNCGSRKHNTYDGPIIISANHVAFTDPVVLLKVFFRRRVHFLVAKEVFANKARANGLTGLGGIKIDRNSFDIDAINQACDVLNKGRALLVFPEGHIIREGEMDTFKSGVAMMSAKTKTNILPIYIAKSKKWYHRHHIFVGDVVKYSEFDMKKMTSTALEVSSKIKALEKIAKDGGYVND